MATHWSSLEVPYGARMISGASTILTLAAAKQKNMNEKKKYLKAGAARSTTFYGQSRQGAFRASSLTVFGLALVIRFIWLADASKDE